VFYDINIAASLAARLISAQRAKYFQYRLARKQQFRLDSRSTTLATADADGVDARSSL